MSLKANLKSSNQTNPYSQEITSMSFKLYRALDVATCVLFVILSVITGAGAATINA